MNDHGLPEQPMGTSMSFQIYPGEDEWYVAEAVHLPVVIQGRTIVETIANLREAVDLHLEEEQHDSVAGR